MLGDDGNPITIPGGRLEVTPDGTVRVENQPVGKLAAVEFDQPHAAQVSAVRQSFIESSNVDMAGAQTTMLELQRAYDASTARGAQTIGLHRRSVWSGPYESPLSKPRKLPII